MNPYRLTLNSPRFVRFRLSALCVFLPNAGLLRNTGAIAYRYFVARCTEGERLVRVEIGC